MSITALTWLLLFTVLSVRGLARPVWALCAYMLTAFAAPSFWWWGKSISFTSLSWNLLATAILGISVAIHWSSRLTADSAAKKVFALLTLFTINVVAVHFLLADFPQQSWYQFDLAWKQAGLSLLIFSSVRSREDIRVFLLAILIGCCYIATEVVVREQGHMEHGRLEGVYMPGAGDSNGLSGGLAMSLPIAGYFVLSTASRWPIRLIALAGGGLVFETLLRSNSRGAYLGVIVATCWFFYAAKGKARKQVLILGCLGIVAFMLQANNPEIWERFLSTFANAEERDNSANERIESWQAAVKMITDYPLGSGGEAAFTSPRGFRYISHFRDEFRAVHNGYLDIAAGWGLQGLFLFLLLLAIAFMHAHRALKWSSKLGDYEAVLLGATIQATLVSQLVVAIFISTLDNEWFYWYFTLLLLFGRLYGPESDEGETLSDDDDYGDVEDSDANSPVGDGHDRQVGGTDESASLRQRLQPSAGQ